MGWRGEIMNPKPENGSPVAVPGAPKNYPDTKKLVTEDCVRPVRLVPDGQSVE